MYRSIVDDPLRAAIFVAVLAIGDQRAARVGRELPLSGFFYTGPDRDTLFHQFHRAADQAPVVALSQLVEAFRKADEVAKRYPVEGANYDLGHGDGLASCGTEVQGSRQRVVPDERLGVHQVSTQRLQDVLPGARRVWVAEDDCVAGLHGPDAVGHDPVRRPVAATVLRGAAVRGNALAGQEAHLQGGRALDVVRSYGGTGEVGTVGERVLKRLLGHSGPTVVPEHANPRRGKILGERAAHQPEGELVVRADEGDVFEQLRIVVAGDDQPGRGRRIGHEADGIVTRAPFAGEALRFPLAFNRRRSARPPGRNRRRL